MVTISNRASLGRTDGHEIALDCLVAGIEAAHPETVVEKTVSVQDETLCIDSVDDDDQTEYDLQQYENVYIVGGGNAAGHLALALEESLASWLTTGAVVTDDPAGTSIVEELRGDHPIPSKRGVQGAHRVLEIAEEADDDDLVVTCITGGGSALLPAPAKPLTLTDLQTVTKALLECGASIDEINAVRKHCSSIKGGQLARAAAPATVVSVVISDVVGDDLGVIASGPTAPDPTTYGDALEVLDRYDLSVPDTVTTHLEAGDRGDELETVHPSDPLLESVDTHVIGNGRTAIDAACNVAAANGYEPLVLSSRVRGEASEAAFTHVAVAEESYETGTPVEPPAMLVSGGETTVTLANDHGRGGPNQEFVLSGAVEVDSDKIVIASVDTDGVDGGTDAAGAIAASSDVPHSEGRTALANNDAFSVLEAANSIISTGPTGTNVNDLRVLVIESRE